MAKVNYYGAEASNGNSAANIMELTIGDKTIRSEIVIPADEEDEDYGYFELCSDIVRQALQLGVDPFTIRLWRDERIVKFEDQYYILMEEAYYDEYDKRYRANAIGTDGCEYVVRWDIINENADDGADTCDWNHPAMVDKI